jgi:hypothetical protein
MEYSGRILLYSGDSGYMQENPVPAHGWQPPEVHRPGSAPGHPESLPAWIPATAQPATRPPPPPPSPPWPAPAPGAATIPDGPAVVTERAVIGDQLRKPVAWCQFGSCIARFCDPAALGEHDVRARALAAGWREDALGRLACPACQQRDPSFRVTGPLVRWDRNAALAMSQFVAAASRARQVPLAPPRQPVPVPRPRPAAGPPAARAAGRHRRAT